ncbi:LysR family transcriptional regulator [Kiloniella antarctica]|uniref:LysR family transcriptional regulator n=1 Tax=Kiloniella antarctica TaxID=1550907 RepID=A0ABW5BT33_9PROT
MVDLNKLRTFTVVAKEGSITKAAERLYRTQPAISAQLKDIEEDTKLVLFERKNSKIYLTKEGRCLFEYAQERINEIDAVVDCLRNHRQNLEGSIRLGVQFEVTTYLIPDIVHEFKKLHPKVRLEIIGLDHHDLEDGLLNNKVDVGLTVLLKQPSFFEKKAFYTFERSLVASASYLASLPPIKKYADIIDQEIIAGSSRLTDFRVWLKKNGQNQVVKQLDNVSKLVTVKERETIHSLIRKGAGMGFFDSFKLNEPSDEGEIIPVLPESKPITITVDITRRKTRTQNVLMDEFHEFLLERASNFT